MGRLKGISTLLSPDLLHALASMGHGDEIVLGDSNFPTSSLCCHNGPLEIRSDGHGIPDLLEAILSIFPIDTYDSYPVNVMDLTDSDKAKGMKAPGVWSKYEALIEKAEGRKVALTRMERFSFYEKAKTAFAIVHTGVGSLWEYNSEKGRSHGLVQPSSVYTTQQMIWEFVVD